MNSSRKNAFEYYQRLAKVRRQLEDNISEPYSIEAAARVANLSPKYFSAYFLRRTGVRFTDWVNATRVEYARGLIRDRNRSITAVAFAAGFQDLRTFERVFKKHRSMTPRAYRREVRPD